MVHSIVTWLNTPDTWEISEQDLTTFDVKHMVRSSDKIQILNEDNMWVDLEINGTPTSTQFINLGMDSITGISEEKWAELDRPVEILTWTNKAEETGEEVNGVEVGYEHYDFIPPKLELTVPEYTLADDLERPLKVLTYSDGEQAPLIKSEYNMVGVGTRIMKRGE